MVGYNPYSHNSNANVLVSNESAIEVPAGTIKEITEWVNGDPDRAQAALDEELKRDKVRDTLASDLQELIDNA